MFDVNVTLNPIVDISTLTQFYTIDSNTLTDKFFFILSFSLICLCRENKKETEINGKT